MNSSDGHADIDPYVGVRRDLQRAGVLANARWRADPAATPWADAAETIGLALMGLPAVAVDLRPEDLTCLEHVEAAAASLDAIPAADRCGEHLINAAHVQAAVRAVQAAQGAGPA